MTPRTVLLVDDDAGTRVGWSGLLRMNGFEVVECASAADALRGIRARQVDLVILDLNLPDMPGIDALRRLRESGVDAPSLVVTRFASLESARDAIRLGISDYLEKPLTGDALVESVKRALRPRAPLPAGTSLPSTSTPQRYAVDRWVRAVASASCALNDPRTLNAWARSIAVSTSTLRSWCYMVRLSPRRSLQFARLLRAVRLGLERGWNPEDLLDVVDRRTLSSMCRHLHDQSTPGGRYSTVTQFIDAQDLIHDQKVTDRLKVLIREE